MKIIKEIGRNPNVDWVAILALSIVIVLSLGFISFSLYGAITSGSFKKEESGGTSFTRINQKNISTVIERFEAKAKVSSSTRARYVGAADPAL